jgi:hypothetical protein
MTNFGHVRLILKKLCHGDRGARHCYKSKKINCGIFFKENRRVYNPPVFHRMKKRFKKFGIFDCSSVSDSFCFTGFAGLL